MVIKKYYPYSNKSRKRKWKLKSMVKEREYNVDKYAAQKEKRDNEIFMREIEQDFDLRCRINVYKDEKHQQNIQNNNDDEDDDDQPPEIPDSELIDELNQMTISKSSKQNIDNNGNNDNDNDQEMINFD